MQIIDEVRAQSSHKNELYAIIKSQFDIILAIRLGVRN
jgi:hypothetical protein